MAKLTEVLVPDIGSFAQVAVIEVHVAPGDAINVDDNIITLESDKAAMDIPSPYKGVVKEVKIKAGDKVGKGSLILTMEAEDAPVQTSAKKETAKPAAKTETARSTPVAAPISTAPVSSASTDHLLTSPAVRRLARELDVNLLQIRGTGEKGRITKEDIKRFLTQGQGSGLPVMPEVDFTQWGEVTVKPLSRIQKISASVLHRNWVVIPHVTQFDQADITEMENFRQANKAKAEKAGAKLTPLVFIMKAVVEALKEYPTFNASLAADGENIVLKNYFHIGVAVDTPNGLVVPVIRDVDKKGLLTLARELAEISQLARDGKLTAAQMQGSCFSISSLGGIGGTAFTPIINAPDVAILGVSKSQMQPVYVKDQFVPRLMLPLSLSYDHRVIDGAVAARFITALGKFLQDTKKLELK